MNKHARWWKGSGKPGSVLEAEAIGNKWDFFSISEMPTLPIAKWKQTVKFKHICGRTCPWLATAIAVLYSAAQQPTATGEGLMAQQMWTGCFHSQITTTPGCHLRGKHTKGGVSKVGVVLQFWLVIWDAFAHFQLRSELILCNLDFNLL